MRRLLALVPIAIVVAVGTTSLGARQEEPFPHDDHEGLFPVCAGCHSDVTSSDRADRYPEPAQCSGCHDGVDQEVVTWAGPSERVSNVSFDHGAHEADLDPAGDDEV